MLKYAEHDINTGGVKTHYYRTGGDKSPFILLHGATDNGLCWTQVAEMLSTRYDVIMPDALGHGLSDRLDSSFTFQQHTEQVAGLVRGLNISQPIIMGHSMGAGTAVNLAIEYPDIPRAIVLEDPPWGVLPPEPESQQSPVADFRASLIRLNKLPLEQIIEERKKQNLSWSDEEILVWAKAKQQFDPSLFSRPIIDQRSYEELVSKIKCPALLIYADAGIVSEAAAKRAAEVWESDKPFRAVQIKGSGHNIRREQYAAFTRVLTDFLSEIS